MNYRVVFDTNILFSAVGWGGTPGRCVELVQTGRIVGLTSPDILSELGSRLIEKLGYTDFEVARILGSYPSFFDVIATSGFFTGPQTDRGDDKILECALLGDATHVVTGDRQHLLPLRSFAGTEIITPRQLINIFERSLA